MAVIRGDIKLINLMLSYGEKSKTSIDKTDLWEGDVTHRHEFASEKYPHRLVKGSTALHYACMIGNMEIVEILLKAGASYERGDQRGWKPERYIFEEDGGTNLKDEFKRLVEEEKARREAAAKDVQETDADKKDDGDRASETSGKATKTPAARAGLDEDTKYTTRESVFRPIPWNFRPYR